MLKNRRQRCIQSYKNFNFYEKISINLGKFCPNELSLLFLSARGFLVVVDRYIISRHSPVNEFSTCVTECTVEGCVRGRREASWRLSILVVACGHVVTRREMSRHPPRASERTRRVESCRVAAGKPAFRFPCSRSE